MKTEKWRFKLGPAQKNDHPEVKLIREEEKRKKKREGDEHENTGEAGEWFFEMVLGCGFAYFDCIRVCLC
jgi:hypothetical protein